MKKAKRTTKKHFKWLLSGEPQILKKRLEFSRKLFMDFLKNGI